MKSSIDKDRYLSLIAHEFHAPLRKIKAFGERLQRRTDEQLSMEGAGDLKRMIASAEQTAAFLDRLIYFERLTLHAAHTAPLSLNVVIQEAWEAVLKHSDDKTAVLHLADLPTIEATPLLIRQLWYELLHNAHQYQHSARPLVVNVQLHSQTDETLTIACSDNGTGFADKYSQTIFEPFTRLNGRSSRSGSGLGLAIAKRIAQQHGGELAASSKPDVGTTLFVTLPR